MVRRGALLKHKRAGRPFPYMSPASAGKSTAHKGLIGCRRIDYIPAETNILPKNAIAKGEQRCSVF